MTSGAAGIDIEIRYVKSGEAAILHKDSAVLDPALFSAVATSMKRHTLKPKGTIPTCNIRLISLKGNKFEDVVHKLSTTANLDRVLDRKSTKSTNVRIICFCQRGKYTWPKSDMGEVSCRNCKDIYHTQCMPHPPSDTRTNKWNCLPCSVPFEGAQWHGGKILNTCPIDNHITLFVNAPHFLGIDILMHLDKREAQAVMSEVIQTLPRSSGKAQEMWYDFFKDHYPQELYVDNRGKTTRYDFWGESETMVLKPLKECHEHEALRKCTNASCTANGLVRVPVTYAQQKPAHMTYATYIEAVTSGTRTETCPACKTGQLTTGPLQWPHNETPWIFRLTVLAQAQTDQQKIEMAEEMMNLPEEIKINDSTYRKAMIIMHDAKHSHFTALHYHFFEKIWLFYDGMRKGSMKYAKVNYHCLKSQQVNCVDYIRLN